MSEGDDRRATGGAAGHASGDDDLRTAFDHLRAVDLSAGPSFAQVVTRSRVSRRRALAATLRAASVAAALTIAVYGARTWITRSAADSSAEATGQSTTQPLGSATGSWRSPTDFLLDVPGARLLRTTPTFGWSTDWIGNATRSDARRGTGEAGSPTPRRGQR